MNFGFCAMKGFLKPAAKKIPGAVWVWHAAKELKRRVTAKGAALPSLGIEQIREYTTQLALRELDAFLFCGEEMRFAQVSSPDVSVIIVLYNRAELTLACLRSLSGIPDLKLEVIVVDNASTDRTAELFKKIRGVHYVRNQENAHFLRGCNQGAELAHGRALLFLNSDAQVLPGSIKAAWRTLQSSPDIGAVGGKLILPDGRLQEAGSLVWQDGTCLGYGRGDDPDFPQYAFRRDVDYCSGAFLLTYRELWQKLGGFDEAYAPAYYEELDYCLRLWEAGKRVVYEPRAVVKHFEFASSKKTAQALDLQIRHGKVLLSRHASTLAAKLKPASVNVLAARSRSASARRLLYIDERLPHIAAGAGYPRGNQIVRTACEAGWQVTVFPAVHVEQQESWSSVYDDLPAEVEVSAFFPYGPGRLRYLMEERQGFYNTIFVSRPTTMKVVRKLMRTAPALFGGLKMVYDAEAIFSIREAHHARLTGKKMSDRDLQEKIRRELSLAEGITHISTVSEQEAARFREQGFEDVQIISHAVTPRAGTRQFNDRKNILFVGAIHDDTCSNADAALWFIQQVLPLVGKELPDCRFVVAGTNTSTRLRPGSFPGVEVLGRVDDLAKVYESCRIFVAPMRFSAGIPLKVIEAAAHGLPSVCSSLAASQLGWKIGEEILAAANPDEFAGGCVSLYRDAALWRKMREAGLAKIEKDYSPASFKDKLEKLLAYP